MEIQIYSELAITQVVQVLKIPWKFQKQLTGPTTTTSQAFQRFMLMGLIRDGISQDMAQVNAELAEEATLGLAVQAAIVGGKLEFRSQSWVQINP